jgi:sulfatase modifying factor 1
MLFSAVKRKRRRRNGGSNAWAFIPQGAFTMGDSLDGTQNAPIRTVTLDAFYMGKYEVTRGEWNEVRTWGLTNGYTDLASEIPMAPSMGFGAASNHPIGYVTWFDAVKWCNARSQKEGLIPIYYTDIAQTTVYKTGSTNLPSTHVKWDANGYRLPTEAEWEKAARGGLNGKRYPLGDTITQVEANYMNFTGQGGADRPNTTAVGTFPPNSYGLYDMAGNISELCWDYYAESYNPTDLTNPRGPTSGINFNSRVVRGGSWASTNTTDVGVALRNGGGQPGSSNATGFRVVRNII